MCDHSKIYKCLIWAKLKFHLFWLDTWSVTVSSALRPSLLLPSLYLTHDRGLAVNYTHSCYKLYLYRQLSYQFLLTKYCKQFVMRVRKKPAHPCLPNWYYCPSKYQCCSRPREDLCSLKTLLSCSPNLLRVLILRYMHNCYQNFCPWRRRMLNKYVWFRTNLRIHQTQCWGGHFKCMWLYMLHQHDVGQNMFD